MRPALPHTFELRLTATGEELIRKYQGYHLPKQLFLPKIFAVVAGLPIQRPE
jgi:hypothetical protein